MTTLSMVRANPGAATPLLLPASPGSLAHSKCFAKMAEGTETIPAFRRHLDGRITHPRHDVDDCHDHHQMRHRRRHMHRQATQHRFGHRMRQVSRIAYIAEETRYSSGNS